MSAEALVEIAPGILRITAGNPGPFTGKGTNTYVVGERDVAVIDPGPDDPRHIEALLSTLAGRPVSHILVTHRHLDHVGGAARLKAATGALTAAAPVTVHEAAGHSLEAAGRFDRDIALADGATLSGQGWRLEAIATPGHASDHLAFALPGRGIIFSGDHVMGWSTSVVAPPDGNMAAYLASLEKIEGRRERLYLPGHGEPIADGPARARGLMAHRQEREAAILQRLAAGDTRIAEIVANVYAHLDPRLRDAAALSVLAHLEDLTARGLVAAEGAGGLAAAWRLT